MEASLLELHVSCGHYEPSNPGGLEARGPSRVLCDSRLFCYSETSHRKVRSTVHVGPPQISHL